MDILFINPQDAMSLKKEVNGQLLLGTLLLQAGFDVDILRFCQIDGYKGDYEQFVHNAVQAVVERNPKAVSFYSLWPDYHIMLRIARELKAVRGDIHVVFGGPQPSATAQATMEAMPFVDAICTGEGEGTVVPFFTALLNNGGTGLKEIPGLFYRENGMIVSPKAEAPLCDLNKLPHWDDRLYLKHYKAGEKNWTSASYYMPIDAGRGCPFKCAFCYANVLRKRTYRLKSPERIVEDIRFFREKFGIKSFWFTHDAYTTNMKLVEKVCDYIIQEKLDITWRCTARIDCINKDLIAKMKQAGLTGIEVGVETGSERMQTVICKNLDLNMVRENVDYVLGQNITLGTFFMYGFPEETEQDLFDTVKLALDLVDAGVNYASMSFCHFNPTTKITEQWLDQLVLDPTVDIPTRGVFGYQGELDVIAANRKLFSFYYNLETPVRRAYQYLIYFLRLYRRFSRSARHLREVFGGDDGKMVRTFFDANRDWLTDKDEVVGQLFREKPLELLYRMLDCVEDPQVTQMKALLQFDFDREAMSQVQEDCAVVKEYAFRYADLKQQRPFAEYGEGSSKILFQKKDDKLSMMLLKNN